MKNNNNKENKELPKLNKRGRVAGLVFSFVAMIALVGAFTFSQYSGDVADDTTDEIADAGDITNESVPLEIETEEVNVENNQITNEEAAVDSTLIENAETEELDMEDTSLTTNVSVDDEIAFGDFDTMIWPIEGETIMWYSMGQAIYFETLNQYKLNDAMIIAGEVGEEVLAGEIGIVESIVDDVETGITVTMDLGNGYSVVYGQLTDVTVTEGSVVQQGEVIGVLAEPTKYYSLEGCNLYLQVLKDGSTVDPFIYLE